MTHDEIQADLASYALGALDAAEQQAVEQHLATGCESCQRELASWNEVVATMALTSANVQAPNLKQALLQRTGVTRRRTTVVALRRWLVPALAAAALALLALAVGRDRRLGSDLDQQQVLVASLRRELETAHGDLQHLAATLAARENDVTALRAALAGAQESLAIVRAPGLQLVRLTKTPDAPSAEAHALISTDTHRALFYGFGLQPLPPDKTYELWWISEKQGPIDAGIFVPDQNGLGKLEGALPADAGTLQAAAVTIEPAGGVRTPTGPMVLHGLLVTRG